MKGQQFLWGACFVLVCWIGANGQGIPLQLYLVDGMPDRLLLDTQLVEASASDLILSAWLSDQYAQGRYAASVDTIEQSDTLVIARVYRGPIYEWLEISPGNVPKEALPKGRDLQPGRPLRQEAWQNMQNTILQYAENHGFPFARVRFDSVYITRNGIKARLHWTPGPFIEYDPLVIEGDAKISKAYLQHYLGVLPGQPYQEKKIQDIRRRIRNLPFLQLSRDPVVVFTGPRAQANLFIKKQPASRFDFVLGLLPQSQDPQDPGRQRLILTGQLEADLFNSLGWGERLTARFEQLQPGRQELQLGFNLPYPLNLPVGGDFQFELYRRDSTYVDVISRVGIQYLFEGGNYLQVFWRNISSNLLSVNERNIQAARQLPENLDVRNNQFGLEYFQQQLDYRFNPRRGWQAQVKASAGIKRIRESTLITEIPEANDGFQPSSLYDSLETRTFQYRLESRLEHYVPLFQRSTFLTALETGLIFSDSPIFQNEQYRLGGNRLLRGFDEETLFATRYAIMTLEYRLLIGRNSYLFLFTDGAYVEDVTDRRTRYDTPLGFGSGLSFETKAGIFGLSLAWGRQQSNPIDWASPRVHFGYLSLF